MTCAPTWDRATSARSPTTSSTVSRGRSRSCRPSTSTTRAGRSCSTAICELPEYYQTRTERLILETNADDIVERTGAAELVELGSGSASKTRVLLDAMQSAGRLERYVPVDVSASTVHAAAKTLVEEYPGMSVHGVVGDFERHLSHLPEPVGPRLVAFLGGTLGNFTPGSRRRFLRGLRNVLGADGYLLLGTDLVKDPHVIEAAYDDSAGVTAQFNLNVLHVSTASSMRTSTSTRSSTSRSSTASASGSRCACARPTSSTCTSASSTSTSTSPRARSCARRSARSSRPSGCAGDLSAAGLELVELYTDPDDLFAVSLSRRA